MPAVKWQNLSEWRKVQENRCRAQIYNREGLYVVTTEHSFREMRLVAAAGFPLASNMPVKWVYMSEENQCI